MIKVKIHCRNEDICAVEVKGHAGYAKHGRDIVCSAVSAVVQTALLAIIDISDEKVRYTVNEEEGYVYFETPEPKDREERIKQQAVLRAMKLGVEDIEKGYSPYVKTEVDKECL